MMMLLVVVVDVVMVIQMSREEMEFSGICKRDDVRD